MILCGGDALIDFVPVTQADGAEAFVPRPGGAVLNAATALARLGQEVVFVGALSRDLFGDMLAAHMAREGIDTRLVARTDDDSTLAFVTLAGGEARYAFYDETSAGRRLAKMPDLPQADALHLGSVTLIGEPAAGAYADMAEAASPHMVVSLDPNCRPTLIRDKHSYCARIERISAVSHILRVSDDDFAYLYGTADEEDVAARVLAGTTALFVISRGADGATAYTRGAKVDLAAQSVALRDTIGAGDTFHAGMLTALSRAGRLQHAALAGLDDEALRETLTFATAAAALNCQEMGCSPPPLSAVLGRIGAA